MAYLHCHKCGWSQDDFWYWDVHWKKIFKWKSRPFGYNPISLVLEDIAHNWKPRYIEFDSLFAKENKWKSNIVHSWFLMFWLIKGHIKRIRKQKWWTYNSWKKARASHKDVCPKCGGNSHWDID